MLSTALVVLGGVQSAAARESRLSATASAGLIVFERRVAGGPTEIHVMNTDGSGVRRLARGCCVEWSPDAKRIAYIGDDSLVYVIATNGSDQQRQLTEQRADLGWSIDALDWSPDGRKIAVASEGRGIFVVNVDGQGTTRLTNGRDSSPRWSPNGRRILFERFLFEPNNSGVDIFVMNADGSQQQRLTHGSGHESPSWAPGGRRIAFQVWTDVPGRKDSLGNWEISVMNANGSDQRPVTRTPRSNDTFPRWSPGGRKILFLSRTNRRSSAVHTVNPDGRGRRNLTRGSTANHEPEWSPDGRSIVFASAREGNWNIFVITATGRNPTNLTRSPKKTQNTSPSWSP